MEKIKKSFLMFKLSENEWKTFLEKVTQNGRDLVLRKLLEDALKSYRDGKLVVNPEEVSPYKK